MTLLRMYRNDVVALTALGVACMAILLPSLVAGGVPQHGDMSYPYSLTNWIDRFVPLWNPRSETSNLQSIDRFWSTVPILLIERWLHVSMSASVRLAYAGETLLAAASGYAYARSFVRRIEGDGRLAPYLASGAALVFTFSPWALSQIQAPWFYLAYGLTPMLMVLFDRAIRFGRPLTILASAFIFSLIASTPQFAGFTVVALVVWVLALVLTSSGHRPARVTILRRGAIWLAVACLLNLYWIVPGLVLATQGVITPGYFLGLQTLEELSRNSGLLHVLSGTNTWVTWYRPILLTRTQYEDVQLVLPALGGIGLALTWRFRARSPYVLWMTIVAALSLGLSTLPSLPDLSNLVYWSVLHLPVGWLLRVPEKSSYLYWVVVPPLAAGALARLAVWAARARERREARTGGGSWTRAAHSLFAIRFTAGWCLLMCVVFAGWGLTSGLKALDLYGAYYRPVQLPRQYSAAFAYLRREVDRPFQALDLAPYDYGEGYNSLHFEDSYTWAPTKIVGYGIGASIPTRAISTYAQQSAFSYFAYEVGYYAIANPRVARSLLQAASVQFVLFHNDIVGTRAVGTAELDGLESVLSLARRFGSVYVLRVPDSKPPLWAVERAVTSRSPLEVALESSAESPPSGFIQVDEWPLSKQTEEVLRRNSVWAGHARSPAMSLAQWFGSDGTAGFVWYPGETDVNDFSYHQWNAMYPEYAYGGPYPWASVAAGLGIPMAGIGTLQAGLVEEAVPDGGVATISHTTTDTGKLTFLGVRYLRSPVGGVIRVRCSGGSGGVVDYKLNTYGPVEGTAWAFARCGGSGLRSRRVTVELTSVTGSDVVLEVVGLSAQETHAARAVERVLRATGTSTELALRHGVSVSGVRWVSSTELRATIDGNGHRLALIASSMPCGVDWVGTLRGRSLPSVCVDGFFQGFLVPAGESGVMSLEYAPQSVFQWWLEITLGCVAGVAALAVWFAARGRSV